MKKILVFLCCMLFAAFVNAQSKVFKEVSDEISTTMEAIIQDGGLVGYVAFTRLEKASEDSFNYKVTIMDENLNDIGVVNFREEILDLEAVAFEQDILCLAYFKSTLSGKEFKTTKAFKNAREGARNAVITQFLNLGGKITKQNSVPVSISTTNSDRIYTSYSKFVAAASLKNRIQLLNVPQKGFVCFFGDDEAKTLLMYNTAGEEQWKKTIEAALWYSLLTTTDDIYILNKKQDRMYEGGYNMSVYGVSDNKNYLNYELKDKEGYSLNVLGFGNDPQTGKPFVSGNIISKKRGNAIESATTMARGTYIGVYNLSFTGRQKTDVKEAFSYWSDGSLEPAISKKGKFADNDCYARFSRSFRDYNGNTYFTGSAFNKKPKWGTIVAAAACAPLIIVSPIIFATSGSQKTKIKNGMLLKQDAKGVLSFESEIEGNSTGYNQSRRPFGDYDRKRFYNVTNSDTKTNYVIMDDEKDIMIYNVKLKKVVRKISHKDGNSRINIYPAKEGHVMVSEYNKKEKYTRFSIEAL
ncbi:MAG: hypothetical protein QM791_03925 [Ferruginibacter sp.]